MDINIVSIDNFHTTITNYIDDKGIKITDIESMIETYMNMIEDKYLFTFDRDLLKDMLVDLTYMYSPKDDANKSRVLFHLVGSDSDDDSDEEDGDDMMSQLMNLAKNMPMGNMPMSAPPPMENVVEEDECDAESTEDNSDNTSDNTSDNVNESTDNVD